MIRRQSLFDEVALGVNEELGPGAGAGCVIPSLVELANQAMMRGLQEVFMSSRPYCNALHYQI